MFAVCVALLLPTHVFQLTQIQHLHFIQLSSISTLSSDEHGFFLCVCVLSPTATHKSLTHTCVFISSSASESRSCARTHMTRRGMLSNRPVRISVNIDDTADDECGILRWRWCLFARKSPKPFYSIFQIGLVKVKRRNQWGEKEQQHAN